MRAVQIKAFGQVTEVLHLIELPAFFSIDAPSLLRLRVFN
jgi:hypothetical protein